MELALAYKHLPTPQREELRIAAMNRETKEKAALRQKTERQKNPYPLGEMIAR